MLFVCARRSRFCLSDEARALYAELAGGAQRIEANGDLVGGGTTTTKVLRHDPHLVAAVQRLGPDAAGKNGCRMAVYEADSDETRLVLYPYGEFVYASAEEAMRDTWDWELDVVRVRDNAELEPGVFRAFRRQLDDGC